MDITLVLDVAPPALMFQSRESVFDLDPEDCVSKTDSAGYVPVDKIVARFKLAGESLTVFRAASAPDVVPDLNPLFTNRALEDRLSDMGLAIERSKQARADYDVARKKALLARKAAREERILTMAKKIATVRAKEAPNAPDVPSENS